MTLGALALIGFPQRQFDFLVAKGHAHIPIHGELDRTQGSNQVVLVCPSWDIHVGIIRELIAARTGFDKVDQSLLIVAVAHPHDGFVDPHTDGEVLAVREVEGIGDKDTLAVGGADFPERFREEKHPFSNGIVTIRPRKCRVATDKRHAS